jgi:hypothetical protein
MCSGSMAAGLGGVGPDIMGDGRVVKATRRLDKDSALLDRVVPRLSSNWRLEFQNGDLSIHRLQPNHDGASCIPGAEGIEDCNE